MSSLLRSLRRALTPDARRAPDHAARPLIRALFLTCFATLPLGACYTDPNEQIDAMQATIDLQDTLNELGMRTTELQFTLDSLRSIVARQDSTIYRLANLAGIPYPRWVGTASREYPRIPYQRDLGHHMIVDIEYCTVWNYEPRAIGLMAALRETFPGAEISLTPSGGGVFEVRVDGELIFSKKALDRHPGPGEIVGLIREKGR